MRINAFDIYYTALQYTQYYKCVKSFNMRFEIFLYSSANYDVNF